MVQKLEKILSFYGYRRDKMDIKKYKTVGEWYQKARTQGYLVPLPMCHGVEMAMKELNMSFAEVFELFEKKEIIIQVGYAFIYNMRGHKGLDDISTK